MKLIKGGIFCLLLLFMACQDERQIPLQQIDMKIHDPGSDKVQNGKGYVEGYSDLTIDEEKKTIKDFDGWLTVQFPVLEYILKKQPPSVQEIQKDLVQENISTITSDGKPIVTDIYLASCNIKFALTNLSQIIESDDSDGYIEIAQLYSCEDNPSLGIQLTIKVPIEKGKRPEAKLMLGSKKTINPGDEDERNAIDSILVTSDGFFDF